MNDDEHPSQSRSPCPGQHLATIDHEGRPWDVYLQLEDDPLRPDVFRALLCYFPVEPGEEEKAARTTAIFIEDSYEAVVLKAQEFNDLQLAALLRSALP